MNSNTWIDAPRATGRTGRPWKRGGAFVMMLTAGAVLSACDKPAAKSAPPVTPAVSVATPIPRKVNEWDEYTGRLASPETVEVRARVSGHIDKIHFKEGSEIEKDALLVTIDPRPYQAVVDRLTAELGAAKARAELARGEATRADGLVKTNAISTDNYEQRRQTAVQADESVLSADAALKAAKLDLEFTEVRAPLKGRISNARVTAGNLVVGGNNVNATVLTTLVSQDPLHCYFEADEASVLRYRQLHREGKRVSAMFSAIPAEMELGNEQSFPHRGEIDFVDNQVNAATGTIRARAVFANPDKLMSPGFFARVRIPGAGEYDAVLVRDSAISSDQGRLFVLTIDAANKTIYRPIKTGPIIDGLRVVREGLSAGDQVIVSGLMSARPGVTVQPQTIPMAPGATAQATPPAPSKP